MVHHVLLLLVVIGLLSLISQWLAWRLRVPALLLLLTSGLLLGPVTGVLNPDELFGQLQFPFISLAVAVILFEGGLALDGNDTVLPGPPLYRDGPRERWATYDPAAADARRRVQPICRSQCAH